MGWKVLDGGGSRIVDGKVVLVFWGDAWTHGAVDPQPYIAACRSILTGPYLDAVDQYGAGPVSYETAVFVSGIATHQIDTDEGRRRVFAGKDSDHMLQTRLVGAGAPFASAADPAERLYVVLIPPGIDIAGNYTLDAPSGKWRRTGNDGGWHGALRIRGRRTPVAHITTGSIDRSTDIFSHELVEAVTNSWVRPHAIQLADDGGHATELEEVADVCGAFASRLSGVLVTSYWSARDDRCIVPTLAEWNQLERPGALLAGSLRLVSRRGQLFLLGLHAAPGSSAAALWFLIQDRAPGGIDVSLDDWWTDPDPPEWLFPFTDSGGTPFSSTAGWLSYAVAVNDDGALRVYAIAADGGLWQNGETVSPFGGGIWRGWSGWTLVDDLGGAGWAVEAGVDRSGRAVVCAGMKTRPGILRFVQRQPSSREFLPPEPLDFDALPHGLRLIANADGRLEIFALEQRISPSGAYGVLRHQWELDAPVGAWAPAAYDLALSAPSAPIGHRGPDDLDNPVLAGRRRKGPVVAMATSHNKGWWSVQEASAAWGGFSSMGKIRISEMACANQRDGKLVLAVTDEHGDVWTAIEKPKRPGFTDWTPIGCPGRAGQVCAALDRHYRIDLVAQLSDGSIWHSRQQHPDHAWVP
jgi:hypothetical protein